MMTAPAHVNDAASPLPPDARDLAAWCERRDQAALAALVSRYAAVVHGVCRRRLGDGADADAAAQAAFIVLARKASTVRPAGLGPWLYGVAMRTSHTVERGNQRRRRHESEAAMPVSSHQPVASDDADWSALRTHLDEAMSSLPEGNRAAVVGHLLQGRTQVEVAAELGVSPDAVRMRVQAALAKLRTWFTRRGLSIGTAGLLAGITREGAAGEPACLTACTSGALNPSSVTTAAAIAAQTTRAMLIHSLWMPVAVLAVLVVGVVSVPRLFASDEFEKTTQQQRLPDMVPFEVLVRAGARADVWLRDGCLQLSLPSREIAGLDDATAYAVEVELTQLYDRYRTLLAAHPPVIERPQDGAITLRFTGLEADLQALAHAAESSLRGLQKTGRLNQHQADFLRVTAKYGVASVVDAEVWNGSARHQQIEVKLTRQPDGLQSVRFTCSSESILGSNSSSAVTGTYPPLPWPEESRIYLPFAGLPDVTPLPPIGSPPPQGLSLAVRNDGQVPLALANLGGLVLARGQLSPSAITCEIADLTPKQRESVTAAYSAHYAAFRSILATHSPTVTMVRPGRATMTFAGHEPALNALRTAADRLLDPLVASGGLSAAQAAFLHRVQGRTLDEATFSYGRDLQRAEIGYAERSVGWVWTVRQWDYEHAGASGSGSGSSPDLPEKFRALLSFVSFAAADALPAVQATPAPQGGQPAR